MGGCMPHHICGNQRADNFSKTVLSFQHVCSKNQKAGYQAWWQGAVPIWATPTAPNPVTFDLSVIRIAFLAGEGEKKIHLKVQRNKDLSVNSQFKFSIIIQSITGKTLLQEKVTSSSTKQSHFLKVTENTPLPTAGDPGMTAGVPT